MIFNKLRNIYQKYPRIAKFGLNVFAFANIAMVSGKDEKFKVRVVHKNGADEKEIMLPFIRTEMG